MDCMFKMMMYSNGYAQMDGPQTDGIFKLICSIIVVFKHDAFKWITLITLNIGTPRPATVVVLNIKQFNFTLE